MPSPYRAWRVTLAPEFLALETTRYTSRDDFFGRFERVLQARRDQINPRVVDRLGVRYIDRVVGDDWRAQLPSLVRPEVAGILGSSLADAVQHTIIENVFSLPDGGGSLMARWGMVPAHATVDPSAIEPVDEPSWLLDLDAFAAQTRNFEVATTISEARAFAERIYTFFRWAVTDEFLRRYGGRP